MNRGYSPQNNIFWPGLASPLVAETTNLTCRLIVHGSSGFISRLSATFTLYIFDGREALVVKVYAYVFLLYFFLCLDSSTSQNVISGFSRKFVNNG